MRTAENCSCKWSQVERIDRNRLGSGTLGQQASLGLCWATAVIFPFETLTFFSSSSRLFFFIFFFCVWGLPVPESELGVYRDYPESRWPFTISSRAPAGGPSNLPPGQVHQSAGAALPNHCHNLAYQGMSHVGSQCWPAVGREDCK